MLEKGSHLNVFFNKYTFNSIEVSIWDKIKQYRIRKEFKCKFVKNVRYVKVIEKVDTNRLVEHPDGSMQFQKCMDKYFCTAHHNNMSWNSFSCNDINLKLMVP